VILKIEKGKGKFFLQKKSFCMRKEKGGNAPEFGMLKDLK